MMNTINQKNRKAGQGGRRQQPGLIILTGLLMLVFLVAVPVHRTAAQDVAAFPGQGPQNPVLPQRLNQVRDDEVLLMTYARIYLNEEGSMNGPVSLPALTDTTNPATVVLSGPPAGPESGVARAPQQGPTYAFFDQHAVARGRFVDPSRDTTLMLTKINTFDAGLITWTLQEMSYAGFQDPHPPFTPAQPGTIVPTGAPAYSFTNAYFNPNTACCIGWQRGAIAAGDLDRKVDKDGNFHDEVALLVHHVDNNKPAAALSVLSYADDPGRVVQPTFVILPIEYDVFLKSPHGGDNLFPGPMAVDVGDYDGDGNNEIAALVMRSLGSQHRLDLFVYRYYPAGVSEPPCTAPCLHLVEDIILDRGGTYNPVDISHGDLDGDGKQEIVVLRQNNVRDVGSPFSRHTVASMYLDLVEGAPGGFLISDFLIDDQASAWVDRGDGHVTYSDVRIVTGHFESDGTRSYPLSQRQVALAFRHRDDTDITVQTHNFDKQAGVWKQVGFGRQTVNVCKPKQFMSFSLAAGAWGGVRVAPGVPSTWGLAIAYEDDNGINAAFASVDPTTLALVIKPPFYTLGRFGECGESGIALSAFDFDGDSLRLGPGAHYVISDLNRYDYILQEPPKHIDWLPDRTTNTDGIVNVSRKGAFNITYEDDNNKTYSTTTSKSSSVTWGGGVNGNITVQGGEDVFSLEKEQADFSFSFHASRDNTSNKSSYTGKQSSYALDIEAVTIADDSLAYESRTTDIWRYPVYGHKASVPGDPSAVHSYYELTLPRALCTVPGDPDPSQCPKRAPTDGKNVDGYMPWHENGNLLSYPAVNPGCVSECYTSAADLGAWKRPHQDDALFKSGDCVRDKTDPAGTDDCKLPLTNPIAATFPGAGRVTVERNSTGVTGDSRGSGHTIDGGFDIDVGMQASVDVPDVFEGGVSACVDGYFDRKSTTSDSTASSTTISEAQAISVVNLEGDSTKAYNFYPLMYIADSGALKVSHGAGTDAPSGQTFWDAAYANADPALNLPQRFYSKDNNGSEWALNPGITAKQMRGLLFLNGNKDYQSFGLPIARPPTIDDEVLKNQLQLQARVYNYSTQTPVDNLELRFDIVEVDRTGHECTDPGSCLTRRLLGPPEISAPNPAAVKCFNPYKIENRPHPQDCVSGNSLPPRGIGLATLPLNFKNLGPKTGASVRYRIYAVVDPADNFPQQTHGWHQAQVILTPDAVNVGDEYTLDIEDAAGNHLEQLSYTSQGTLDDVLKGLAQAVSASKTAATYDLVAEIVHTGKTVFDGVPHIAIATKDPNNGVLKPGTEFRAGFVLKNPARSLYFIPHTQAPTGDRAPSFTATNDVPGQNNEGWGYLTIMAAETAIDLVGVGSNPLNACKPKSLDLSLAEDSLRGAGLEGDLRSGLMRTRPGHQVNLHLNAHSNVHNPGFEWIDVFHGDPDNGGQQIAHKMIQGVDAETGGPAHLTWLPPQTPGVYPLVARLREPLGDMNTGNNRTTLEVVVVAQDAQVRGHGKRHHGVPGRGKAFIRGTQPLAKRINLSKLKTATLWNLLYETGGAGELLLPEQGADALPLQLVREHSFHRRVAVFKTPYGASPRVWLSVTQPRHGSPRLLFLMKVSDATMPDPQNCGKRPSSTELATTFTLDGAGDTALISASRPWRCYRDFVYARQ